ncbi:hypothetical protein DPMN_022132 [Dreissena polymorpha]|uniref:Uncharacterized protein n=1 Tax=Dreissena polymorpha TaxID=45954 RepID=A0A9D4NN55_DREPO|nr:hypothetical protein DPMN_022132 [Dreissena polymorpha]
MWASLSNNLTTSRGRRQNLVEIEDGSISTERASLLNERNMIQLMQEHLYGLHCPTNSIGALEGARFCLASLFN